MNEQAVMKFVEEAVALLIKKNQDYSSDNITMTGLKGVVVRLMDKIVRLNNLTSADGEPNFEGIRDTIMDIFNYAIIANSLQDGSWTRSTKFVYLAGSIDAVSVDTARNWRYAVSEQLSQYGISTFNPATAFTSAHRTSAEKITTINRHVISISDIVLVKYSGGEFGTIREIEYAKSIGKTVIVADVNKSIVSFESHDLIIVGTMEEAVSLIVGK